MLVQVPSVQATLLHASGYGFAEYGHRQLDLASTKIAATPVDYTPEVR